MNSKQQKNIRKGRHIRNREVDQSEEISYLRARQGMEDMGEMQGIDETQDIKARKKQHAPIKFIERKEHI